MFAVVAAFLVVLVVGVGAVYAYDSSKKHVIAQGVKIGGVDVGGMSDSEAKRALASAYLDKLKRPIVVRAGTQDLHADRQAGPDRRRPLGLDRRGADPLARRRHRLPHVPQRPRRAGQREHRAPARLLERRRARARRRRCSGASGSTPRTPRSPSASTARRSSAARRAPGSTRPSSRQRIESAIVAPSSLAHDRGAADQGDAEPVDRRRGQALPDRPRRRPHELPAQALPRPQAHEDLHRGGRPGRASRPRPASTTSRTRR